MTTSVRSRIVTTAGIGLAAVAAILTTILWTPMPTQAQEGAVAKLYADLYKLDPTERRQRLLEGARKEGKADLQPNFRGSDGDKMREVFFAENPGVEAAFDRTPSQSAAERLIAEARAGRHSVDVVGGAVTDQSAIYDKKLYAPYPTPATQAILPKYRNFIDPQNRWSLSHWQDHGMAYNPSLVKAGEEPRKWEDLCEPRFKGSISFDPSETRLLSGLYTMYNGDWNKIEALIKCIGENEPIVMLGHPTRLMLMMAGDHAVQGENFFYKGTELNRKNPKKAPFKAVYEAPVFAYAEGFVVNANAPHPHTAALYLDWVLGPTSQKMIGELWRGTFTVPHPFHPDDITLITFGEMDVKVIDRLHGYWAKYVGRR